MPGTPDPKSVEGRLLDGLTYSPGFYPGIGTRVSEYTSRFERRGSRKIIYTIYSNRPGPHSELFVQTTVTRLNFRSEPVGPPKGSPLLTGSAGKWSGQGVQVDEGNLAACRELLLHELQRTLPA